MSDGDPAGPIDTALRARRRATREALIAARLALPHAALQAHRERIDHHLERAFPDLAVGVVAFCWPYRNEYDGRFLARRLRERGTILSVASSSTSADAGSIRIR